MPKACIGALMAVKIILTFFTGFYAFSFSFLSSLVFGTPKFAQLFCRVLLMTIRQSQLFNLRTCNECV